MSTLRTGFVLALLLLSAACTAGPAPTLEQNKDLVRRFVQVSNARQWDSLDVLLAPTFSRHSQATPDVQVESRDQMLEFLRQDSLTFPDSRVTVERMIAEGDLVVVQATYAGTQQGAMGPFPATGKRVSLELAGIFRVQDGMIADLWVTWDNLAALTQLGLFPPPGSAGGSPG